MDNFYLNEIVAEVAPVIIGRRLTRATLHGGEEGVVFRLEFGGGLATVVARLSGADPALYLGSKRRGRDAEPVQPELHSSSPGRQLLLQIRSKLIGADVASIEKDDYDRVVRIALNGPHWSENRSEVRSADFTLILNLTGRSANAVLIGQPGLIEAALKETGPIQIGSRPPQPRPGAFDPDLALRHANQGLTSDEILKSYFGRSSPFSKMYEKEFLARAGSQSPSLAFSSLLEDLFKNERTPLLYSSVPLDELTASLSSPAAEVILSCIKLTMADTLVRYDFASFSEAAEIYSETVAQVVALRARYARLTRGLEARLKKLTAALGSIQSDLARFAESDKLKRFGDLLLANLTTARVESRRARVKDYYESGEPEIEIEIESDQTLQQAAADYYERYQKARRAVKTLGPRAQEIRGQIAKNEEFLSRLVQQPDLRMIEEIESRSGPRRGAGAAVRTRGPRVTGPGVKGSAAGAKGRGAGAGARVADIGRRFVSSDGLEIVVGRNDAENDAITFRVAGSLDIWMHAADYPGSHVVIRNPSRQAVPQRSIIEAARIAAFYSQARRQGKAAVNYTQKKFVTKPPRAKPGLVRLSSYKTLLVEPGIPAGLNRDNLEPSS
jgi:predicted ribosome quality control (RQC) complex YloA/Tae2 family protein